MHKKNLDSEESPTCFSPLTGEVDLTIFLSTQNRVPARCSQQSHGTKKRREIRIDAAMGAKKGHHMVGNIVAGRF